MKNVLLFLWQLPQIIIGSICIGAWCIITSEYYWTTLNGTIVCFFDKFPSWISGICFGTIAGVKKIKFMNGKEETNITAWYVVADVAAHELGHSLQSKILGPLYLVAIAIQHIPFWIPYEKRFMEAWANNNKQKIKIIVDVNKKILATVN